MAAPFPSDPATRRNRTPPRRGEWTDLATNVLAAEDVVLPPLADNKDWCEEARRAWTAWSRSPITTWWTSGDIGFAQDTLLLYADFGRHAGQIAARMDKLGLSPAGMRSLRIRPAAL